MSDPTTHPTADEADHFAKPHSSPGPSDRSGTQRLTNMATWNAGPLTASSVDDSLHPETLSMLKDTESGMTRFFDESYTSSEHAQISSKSLVEAFDDKGLWLAGLVQPVHLLKELRQDCSIITQLVIPQWVRQGETHKLKMLGEQLLNEPSAHLTYASARIMALLAGFLGILRPQTAQSLMESCQPLLKDSSDKSLVQDSMSWVAVGRLLGSISPDERIFWNRRLRQPEEDWEWQSAEARMALLKLSKHLPKEEEDLEIFHKAVPGCWWDLWREGAAVPDTPTTPSFSASSSAPMAKPRSGRLSSFIFGIVVGLGLVIGLAFVESRMLEGQTVADHVSIQSAPVGELVTSEPEEEPMAEGEIPAPPIRESLTLLKSVLAKSGAAIEVSAPLAHKEPVVAAMKDPKTDARETLQRADSADAKKQQREKQKLLFAQFHPEVKRLCNLVKQGTIREHNSLIQGQTSFATRGSMVHQDLLKMLILDPPTDPEVRLASMKIALRGVPPADLLALFDTCLYPGSPNEKEIRQCVQLLAELPADRMTETQSAQLNALLKAAP